LPVWLENAYSRPKTVVLGVFHPENGQQYHQKNPKGTSAGRSDSSGVLIMSLSAIVPEKSPGNKKCDEEEEEEEEERHIFGLFGIAVKCPRHGCMQLF